MPLQAVVLQSSKLESPPERAAGIGEVEQKDLPLGWEAREQMLPSGKGWEPGPRKAEGEHLSLSVRYRDITLWIPGPETQ